MVRGLVSLLHGSENNFTSNDMGELEELLELLGIRLSDSFSHLDLILRARGKRKINNEEDDVVITFDKKESRKVGSNIGTLIRLGVRESPLRPKKRRVDYHTKNYTDWSKVAAEKVVIKEEPVDDVTPIPIIQRVTYDKKTEMEPIITDPMVEEASRTNCSGSDTALTDTAVDLSFKKNVDVVPVKGTVNMEQSSDIVSDETSDELYDECKLVINDNSQLVEEKVECIDDVMDDLNEQYDVYEPAVVEEQTITTVIIDNDEDDGSKNFAGDSSVLIHTKSPGKPYRKNKAQNSGLLKTEEEAKVLVNPYIAKIDSKPPRYKCIYNEKSDEGECDYSNSRLLMTQCHVYKHLDIYLYQCSYCDLKCRLETNFEKHLNTHGVTRRKEKMGKYIYLDEKSDFENNHVKIDDDVTSVSAPAENDCQKMFSDYVRNRDTNTDTSYSAENEEANENIHHFENERHFKIEEENKLEKELLETIDNLPVTQTLLSPDEGAKRASLHYYKEDETARLVCKICLENKEYFDCEKESVMKTHVFKHLNIFIAECKFCGELFRSKQLLKCHNDHVHCKTAEEAFSILDEECSEEEGRKNSQQNKYHMSKKAVFMGEDKARSIISSYIVYNMRKENGEMDLRLECSLCQFRNESEIEVYEHIAIDHLNIYQYKCDFCSMKVKIKRHLIEHMLEKHGLDQFEEKTEMLITQSEDGSVSFVNDQCEVELTSTGNEDEAAGITLNVPVQIAESYNDSTKEDDDFPYAEHNMTVKVGANGAKKVFVGDAKYPLLRLNRSVLNKLSRGKLLSKKQAEEMVFGYTIHNAESKMYECTLCNGAVQKEKSYLIQRHLYDHFNIYFYRCEMCNDIFRFANQFKDHLEAHKKAETKSKVGSEKRKASHMKDKIGNYHEAEDESYIPAEEAKEIVESYYTFEDNGEESFSCKLCDFKGTNNLRMYNHCLKQHLKIYQYKCDLCQELFKLDIEIKRHYMKIHRKKYEKSSKLEKLAKSDKHYESLETDFPDVDISKIPMDLLKGKKISTIQAKSIKGLYMIFNEATKMHECELCEFKREWRGNLQFHVLADHFDVYLYRCPHTDCGLLLRNWSAFQTHQKSHREPTPHVNVSEENQSIVGNYHLLEEPIYVGEEEGLKIARGYHYFDSVSGQYRCKMCSFSARSQQTSIHVLAKHLPFVFLYRCEYCGKDFRYSRVRWKEHLALHREGKVRCEQCPDASEKEFTKESLKAHIRRNHTLGRFTCGVAGCGMVFTTKGEMRVHEKDVHLIGLPAKCVSHVCEWCDYAFPTRSRWKKHVILCQRGTSRTGFRKQISDVLLWLGKGAYKCTFCGAEFHPEPDNVTRTGLPEARNHVASVHGMKHMRKAKMQWHGDPKHYNKDDLYRDKTLFWNQKVKDIEKVRNMAQQESKLFSIQNEVNENIAEAAKSHKAMIESLGYEDNKGLDSKNAVFMKLLPTGPREALEPGQLGTLQLQPGDIVEDGLVDNLVLVNIVNENGEIEQRQIILDQSGGASSLMSQTRSYFDQEDVEPGNHDLHNEVVFEENVRPAILGDLQIGQQTVVLQTSRTGYKPQFPNVGNIQIIENIDESNMEYVEVPPQ